MPKHGKRFNKTIEEFDPASAYNLDEAIKLVKKFATSKFDETVELVVNLGIDPKKADQQLRGTVSLPNGTGKTVRIAVFAEGELATEAEEAGADIVGSEDLAKKISEGFMDFDLAIAAPDMMRHVGRLGKVLGPRGLMPNPKTGTVTKDIGKAVEEFKAGRIEYRANKSGGVHVPVGKASFDENQLMGNLQMLIRTLLRAKPSSAKGTYMISMYISSTMGPGVKVDVATIRDFASAA
jgi:large subunit ribosomal protein L1